MTFSSSFNILSSDRKEKLSKNELLRALRFLISAEYEAIQLYQQLSELSDNKLFTDVINNIINEEKIHSGEFLKVLIELDKDEREFIQKGFDEVIDLTK